MTTASAVEHAPTTPSPAVATLEVKGAHVAFEGLVALEDVDLCVRHGEILGLIGPNGAGKSTLLNVISGFARADAGVVSLEGRDITHLPPHRRARLGIGRSFQAARVFHGLTVRENIEAGVVANGGGRRAAFRRSQELLEYASLTDRADALATTLPAGVQQSIGILRALSIEPRFLLLDEPAAGFDDDESAELVEWIRTINRRFGCSIVVIDHDMRVIMPLCERIQVLNQGRTICVGTPAEVRADRAVLTAYLGAADAAALEAEDR